jgi:flagellin
VTISVHTNKSALTALHNLNRSSDKLTEVQGRISTGLKVNGAKDNPSTWAVAQKQRADIGAIQAVKTSLDRAQSVGDVALAAGESISDLLNEIKAKVTLAMDPSISPESRSAINNDFRALLRQIADTVENAEFDGANILNGSLSTAIKFLSNADADKYIDLTPINLTFGSSNGLTLLAADGLTASTATASVALATSVMTRVQSSISQVNGLLSGLGSELKQIEAHNKFIAKLTDVLDAGVGNLVDADLAKESARLQALQVQQQLGTQALSIANQAPQVILSLFRS